MKTYFATFFLSLFFCVSVSGQEEFKPLEFSFSIQNGISNQHSFTKSSSYDDNEIAYVNAFRFQLAFVRSKQYSFIVGLQYGANGSRENWICDTSWEYCETIGAPPIAVRSTERKKYASLFFHPRYIFVNDFYMQGGLSMDLPFQSKSSNKYTDNDGEVSRESDSDFHWTKMRLNASLGTYLAAGKKISIAKRWDLFFELEYKLYNMIADRDEDYEDYFFKRHQRPWVLGVNVGVAFY